MNCDVIKDLIPLYIDGCCSVESTAAVREHLAHCQACKALAEEMSAEMDLSPGPVAPKTMKPLNQWKASILQSILLFASFGLITIGVALEARIGSNSFLNGYCAFNLVIPATGFMLSLANWYFLPIYKSKNTFSNCSLLATVALTLSCYAWTLFHYEINLFELFTRETLAVSIEVFGALLRLNSLGIGLTVLFCVLSKTLSVQYAKLIGKE